MTTSGPADTEVYTSQTSNTGVHNSSQEIVVISSSIMSMNELILSQIRTKKLDLHS